MSMNGSNSQEYPNRKPGIRKVFDPQIIVEGNLRQGPQSDVIVFRLRLLIVDLTCVVTIPPDGETKAPVYVKFKIHRSQNQPPGSRVIRDHRPEVYTTGAGTDHSSNLPDDPDQEDETET